MKASKNVTAKQNFYTYVVDYKTKDGTIVTDSIQLTEKSAAKAKRAFEAHEDVAKVLDVTAGERYVAECEFDCDLSALIDAAKHAGIMVIQ